MRQLQFASEPIEEAYLFPHTASPALMPANNHNPPPTNKPKTLKHRHHQLAIPQ